MLHFIPISVPYEITPDNPLWVGHVFDLRGMWWRKRRQRQQLILSIAACWGRLKTKNKNVAGIITKEMLLTSLTAQSKDAGIIIDYFFKIIKKGYNFHNGIKSPTIVTPRKLSEKMYQAVQVIINDAEFYPAAEPILDKKLVKSKVKVLKTRINLVLQKLVAENKQHLLPVVKWLYTQDEITFYYKPAGSLMARDTSVWPVKSIETWPGWLRSELFGKVIDIDNAYCQFITSKLSEKYHNNKSLLAMKYPDLLSMNHDRTAFRNDICENVLKMPVTDSNINIVKKLLMSIANGSNISPALIACGNTKSEAVRIVKSYAPHLTLDDYDNAGKRLQKIKRQFTNARRDLCFYLLNSRPTRSNQKKIFKAYFLWEREARYSIWAAVDKTGLHLHDGLDGIYSNKSNNEIIDHINRVTNIKVSIESPPEELHI